MARDVRAELQLAATDPLSMLRLAEHLAIPLKRLRTLQAEHPDAVRHFTSTETGAFSAVTVFHGRRRVIWYNDSHAPTRIESDLAHEIAHALLQHPPQAALDERGCRIWPAEHEEEADWLGGALLVSEEAALLVAAQRIPLSESARMYGVSPDMMRFRLNVTGATRRTRTGSWRRVGARG